jgi:hypothetical protein
VVALTWLDNLYTICGCEVQAGWCVGEVGLGLEFEGFGEMVVEGVFGWGFEMCGFGLK